MAPHTQASTCGSHCDPAEHQQIEGTQDSLYSKIDLEQIVALNIEGESNEGSKIFLPWDQRNQEAIWIESDADDQLILQVPFTGSIKLRSITIKGGPGDYTPDKVKIFANQTLDFDEASTAEPTQSIDIPITREAVEFALRPSKFPAVQNVTLFFPASHGEDTTRISYIGFKGEYSEIPSRPTVIVYELKANPADHKVSGMDSVHSQIG